MRILRHTLSACALLLLSGCVTWQPGGQPYTARSGDYRLTPPPGWMFIEAPAGTVRATRDGLVLQELTVTTHELKTPLPNSKRVLTSTLTAFELAEAVADDLRTNREFLNFEIVANEPATIGGREGFALTVRYQTKDKLRLTIRIAGVIQGNKLYTLRFAAPTRHYFERDLPAFTAAVQSFRWTKS